MLETIREFGLERLERAARSRPPEIATPATSAIWPNAPVPEIVDTADPALLDMIDREHDNLRAALAWSRDTGDHDTLLRLAGALAFFWYYRGYLNEGRRWLEPGTRDASRCGRAAAAGLGAHDSAGCWPTCAVKRSARPRC